MSNETLVKVRKHTMLPVLVILFVVAYSVMTMLIVEQGNTIESQKLLIRQLFSDSAQLSALKGKAAREKSAHKAPAVKPGTPQAAQPKRVPKSGPKLDAREAVEHDGRRMLVSI